MDAELDLGRWQLLQQARAGQAEDLSFLRLLAALDAGWRVKPPVLQRPQAGFNGLLGYQFTLIGPQVGQRVMLEVAASTLVRELIERESLPLG